LEVADYAAFITLGIMGVGISLVALRLFLGGVNPGLILFVAMIVFGLPACVLFAAVASRRRDPDRPASVAWEIARALLLILLTPILMIASLFVAVFLICAVRF
jgi:TRAP-type C4-dicarboxylate transport system permease large subunit